MYGTVCPNAASISFRTFIVTFLLVSQLAIKPINAHEKVNDHLVALKLCSWMEFYMTFCSYRKIVETTGKKYHLKLSEGSTNLRAAPFCYFDIYLFRRCRLPPLTDRRLLRPLFYSIMAKCLMPAICIRVENGLVTTQAVTRQLGYKRAPINACNLASQFLA